ncbi:MAG: polyprenol monophosphomannose synthase [Candidatus Saccharicenans sp.]|nr:MAG: dolichyl-phosphate beta-D-mannosyltransferase [Candidatus Aminicenantes bacterium]HEK85763.1 polyprenol monophosphomannose synthase [Candidatus Aminicenantes bacterium]
MKNGKKALVIVPTYNEAQNIELLVEKLLNLTPAVDILIVDDNSPDGTGKIAEALSQKHPERVSVLHRPGKLGLGTAHQAGFSWGLERGYEQLVTMDADFSHPAEAIPSMLDNLGRAGMVIGSRYVAGGKTEGWTLMRKINSWTANFLARRLMRLKPRDCTGAFRAYRSEYLRQVPFNRLIARGYSAHLEVLYYFQKLGAEVVEVPIVFVNRKEGRSKISRREIREALKIMFYYWRHRPQLYY